jgi:tRNA(His) guanylyltransferase
MDTSLLQRLRGFHATPVVKMDPSRHLVARMRGVGFPAILASPEFGFETPFDLRFTKMLVRVASQLLGGESCGVFAFAEQFELSVCLSPKQLAHTDWENIGDLQTYLVGIAAARMSLQLGDEAVFDCELFAFPDPQLVHSYFVWRRSEALATALENYSYHVLTKDNRNRADVQKLIAGLGPKEREVILRQNGIDWDAIPRWQRDGTGLSLDGDGKLRLNSELPEGPDYMSYLKDILS